MYFKKKTIITGSIVAGIVLLILFAFLFVKYIMHQHWLMEVVRTEIYENETEYIEIGYQNDGSFLFSKKKKDDSGGFSCGAEFVSDNVAVYDGKYSLPALSMYYEFIFVGDRLFLLNHGELVDEYVKKTSASD